MLAGIHQMDLTREAFKTEGTAEDDRAVQRCGQ